MMADGEMFTTAQKIANAAGVKEMDAVRMITMLRSSTPLAAEAMAAIARPRVNSNGLMFTTGNVLEFISFDSGAHLWLAARGRPHDAATHFLPMPGVPG